MREDIYNGMEIEWLSEDQKELEIFTHWPFKECLSVHYLLKDTGETGWVLAPGQCLLEQQNTKKL